MVDVLFCQQRFARRADTQNSSSFASATHFAQPKPECERIGLRLLIVFGCQATSGKMQRSIDLIWTREF